MTQEEAVMTVMRRSGVWRSLLDVASWFAGSYEEMALAGEYALSHGYRFLYDPRPLQFQIEWLDGYYWYRIFTPDLKTVQEGFEKYEGEYAYDDRQLVLDLKRKWLSLDKPEPSKDEKALADYMLVPRTVILNPNEEGTVVVPSQGLEPLPDGRIRATGEYMCRFRFTGRFPDSFTKDGVRYRLDDVIDQDIALYRSQRGDTERIHLPETFQ